MQITDDLEGALFGINSVKTYFNNYLDKLEKDRRQFDRAEPSEGSFLSRVRKSLIYFRIEKFKMMIVKMTFIQEVEMISRAI